MDYSTDWKTEHKLPEAKKCSLIFLTTGTRHLDQGQANIRLFKQSYSHKSPTSFYTRKW